MEWVDELILRVDELILRVGSWCVAKDSWLLIIDWGSKKGIVGDGYRMLSC